MLRKLYTCFFFFNDTATTEIYTLSLHDALPICARRVGLDEGHDIGFVARMQAAQGFHRSEEHTSELQSRLHLVCRLLLEKKKKQECQSPVPLSNFLPSKEQPIV